MTGVFLQLKQIKEDNKFMKLIVIPPYRGMNWIPTDGHYMLSELINAMQKRGQLEGVEITIDEGQPSEHNTKTPGDAFYIDATAGFLKRIRIYCDGDKYDAIISSAGNDLGFHAARMLSKIPVVFSLHAVIHIASLIGDRFSVLQPVYSSALTSRHSAENYGFGPKLVSARYLSYPKDKIAELVYKKKEGQVESSEMKKFIDEVMAQCIMAIEEDRVDTLALVFPGLQCFVDEIREKLNGSGYNEIPIISALPAAIEMAKAMVNMKLKQASRAYPSHSLKAIPKFR